MNEAIWTIIYTLCTIAAILAVATLTNHGSYGLISITCASVALVLMVTTGRW